MCLKALSLVVAAIVAFGLFAGPQKGDCESVELKFDGRTFKDGIDGLITVRRELMAARGCRPDAPIALVATGNAIVDRELLKYADKCSNVTTRAVSPELARKSPLCNACAPKTRVMEYHGARGTDWWTDRLQIKRDQILRQPQGEFDVVMFGDSITHFFEWPYFDPTYDKFIWRYRTLNLGYGGDRTDNVIWRCENGELDGYRAKCVTLMIGTNNPDSPQDVAAGIRRILDLIAEKQPQATTVLLPIFPRGESASDPSRVKNEKVNKLIRAFADGKKVLWLDFNDQLVNEKGDVIDFFGRDRLHPNARGYKVWLEALTPIVEHIVRSEKGHCAFAPTCARAR